MFMVQNASKKVQDALVCVVAQKINHALREVSARASIRLIGSPNYLWHNSLAVLAFDIFERHLHALGCRDLDARAVDVRNLSQRNFDSGVSILRLAGDIRHDAYSFLARRFL